MKPVHTLGKVRCKRTGQMGKVVSADYYAITVLWDDGRKTLEQRATKDSLPLALEQATNPNAGQEQAYPAGRWTGGAK